MFIAAAGGKMFWDAMLLTVTPPRCKGARAFNDRKLAQVRLHPFYSIGSINAQAAMEIAGMNA
jgi:hypothetical protein